MLNSSHTVSAPKSMGMQSESPKTFHISVKKMPQTLNGKGGDEAVLGCYPAAPSNPKWVKFICFRPHGRYHLYACSWKAAACMGGLHILRQ